MALRKQFRVESAIGIGLPLTVEVMGSGLAPGCERGERGSSSEFYSSGNAERLGNPPFTLARFREKAITKERGGSPSVEKGSLRYGLPTPVVNERCLTMPQFLVRLKSEKE
jgi:hypothetical protein